MGRRSRRGHDYHARRAGYIRAGRDWAYIPFLQAVYDHDRFERGDITTAFIADEYPDGFEGAEVNLGHTRKIAAMCALMHDISEHRAAAITGALANHARHIPDEWAVQIGDTHYTADINGEQGLRTIVMDNPDEDKAAIEMEVLTSWKPGQELVRAFVDNNSFNFKARKCAEGYTAVSYTHLTLPTILLV